MAEFEVALEVKDQAHRACERRIYRLARLLAGDPSAAAGITSAVLGPRLSSLERARLDRITILRARELWPRPREAEAGTPVSNVPLAAMTAQQREAWILNRVDLLPPREAARSMDCSVSAMRRHLEAADGVLALGQADVEAMRSELTAYGEALELPPDIQARQERRRRWDRVLARVLRIARWSVGFVLLAVLVYVALRVVRAR